MQTRTLVIAATILAAILLSSAIFNAGGSIATPAFAQPLSDHGTIGQHVQNDKSMSIKSISIELKRKFPKIDGQLEIQIIQNGTVEGTATIAKDKIKRTYSMVTAKFSPAVKVDADNFDVVLDYNGSTGVLIKSTSNKMPGNMFVDDKERPKLDLKLKINGVTSSEDEEDTAPPPPPAPTVGNVHLTLVSKNIADLTPINGMHYAVIKGIEVIADGYTPNAVEVPAGQTYTIAPASGYQNIEFAQWQDTKSTDLLRTETVTKDTTLTVLYTVDEETSTASPPPPTSTNNTDQTNQPPPEPTPDSGAPNTVTVSSQLLDGSAVTGLETQLRESATGNNVDSGFTTTTLQMEAGKDYRTIMYSYSPYWFRHWTDGGLHRYHLVSGDGAAHSLTAVFENIPTSQEAQLWVKAKTSDGTPIGGTTGTQEDNTLQAQPGIEVLVAPPNTLNAYTAGFTGGSEASPFHLVKGQTYTITMEEFGQYKFSHWEDNNLTNPARAVPLNSDSLTLTAVYDVIQ